MIAGKRLTEETPAAAYPVIMVQDHWEAATAETPFRVCPVIFEAAQDLGPPIKAYPRGLISDHADPPLIGVRFGDQGRIAG
jgi:hypothetical protein